LSVALPTKDHYVIKLINDEFFDYEVRVVGKTASSFQLKTWSKSGSSYVTTFIDECHFEVFAP